MKTMKLTKIFCLLVLSISSSVLAQKQEKKNILFIIVDDLRPELNCYGNDYMVTPNIDKLAEGGVLFENAYVNQAVCSASRASFLTGVRPDVTGVDYPYSKYFVEEFLSTHKTISSYFYSKGYYTRNIGKVHHGKYDRPLTEKRFSSKLNKYADPENASFKKNQKTKSKLKGPAVEAIDVEDENYQDGEAVVEAMATLDRATTSGKPFCISVGFYKPHLPFNAPKKYWDLYEREAIPLAPNRSLPENTPEELKELTTTHYSLSKYVGEKYQEGVMYSDARSKELRHGYFACVSFIDAQIGKLYKKLEELDVLNNTTIVLIGDHGWHLGDQGMWGKTTNFENATRIPMIIMDPNLKKTGVKTKALVEAVDIYPTLIDLSGVEEEIPTYLEGTSMKPVLDNPKKQWKKAVFSQFPRGTLASIEGYSIRTDQFRYTEWWDNENKKFIGAELYDHKIRDIEDRNVVADNKYTKNVEELSIALKKGWKAALPKGVVNTSDNPLAPRSVPVGSESKGRLKQWEKYIKKKEAKGEEPIYYLKPSIYENQKAQ
ncbi:sulfatase [Flammeovirga sp. SubArs3]|uniref:sulfatase n=1 Tax=Flammeovirga sp. SubArs3 TaxID=2995316 RepID=UPI00248CAFE2|nr:sulfatase [Flammeovirga sp. SubArs3]